MRQIITESGIRDINDIAKRYPKAKIYFHIDLDGVTTALAMKNYLEQYGIKVVDAEVIQYGDKEFAVKKPEAETDTMPVLVDFAHGKPMFVIHTDHHDTQAGVEKETSTSFRQARSNVETISQVLSPKEIFSAEDVQLISTVDSANYLVNNITPDMVMNYIFDYDKDKSVKNNKMTLGLVVNKLLLAFKNKPKFLETLVMDAQPSLTSIFNIIKREIKDKGYPEPGVLKQNQEKYVEAMKTNPNVKVEDGIIVQYGGGPFHKAGSYDRYTPFKNNPDADFIIIAWPMGIVQSSCNPFKQDRKLKGINLGEVKDVVLSKWESKLKEKPVSLYTIKRVSEMSAGEGSVGFTFKDFVAIYGDNFKQNKKGKFWLDKIKEALESRFKDLTRFERDLLKHIEVSSWDIIQANSGGHKCITNISGLNYLGKEEEFDPSKESPYVTFTKMIQKEFFNVLKGMMENSKD